jgi:hypothetical protein
MEANPLFKQMITSSAVSGRGLATGLIWHQTEGTSPTVERGSGHPKVARHLRRWFSGLDEAVRATDLTVKIKLGIHSLAHERCRHERLTGPGIGLADADAVRLLAHLDQPDGLQL